MVVVVALDGSACARCEDCRHCAHSLAVGESGLLAPGASPVREMRDGMDERKVLPCHQDEQQQQLASSRAGRAFSIFPNRGFSPLRV